MSCGSLYRVLSGCVSGACGVRGGDRRARCSTGPHPHQPSHPPRPGAEINRVAKHPCGSGIVYVVAGEHRRKRGSKRQPYPAVWLSLPRFESWRRHTGSKAP
ncbi:hypothetical protein GCM10010206_28020 [Streptomyces cinerochromogenes]|nr:hypothetical protein GCM10010206_28020 [Streptomyces cinerochromogenes]